MSTTILGTAWKLETTPTRKLILLALADHANDEDFQCWPSLTHLQKKTGLDRRTITRNLQELENEGFIGRHPNERTGTTMYTVNVRYWSELSGRGTAPLGAQNPQGRGTAPLEVGAQCPSEPSIEPSGNRQSGSTPQNAGSKGNGHAKKNGVARPDSVSQEVWSDFLAHRRGKRAPLTQTAWKRMQGELDALVAEGWSGDDVLGEVMAAGWQSFKAEWIRNRLGNQSQGVNGSPFSGAL